MSFLGELVPPTGPTRVLSLSNLAKTVGHGVVTSVIVLYFTGRVGIGVDQVGLALSAGAALGMLGSVPLGHLADLYGPRNVTVALLYLLGIFVAAYAFVRSFPRLVVVVSLALMAESAAYASRGALIAGLIPPEERVRTSSYMRSVANVGIGIGAAVGGVALYLDSTAVYLGVLIGGGVCFVLSGSAYLTVPSVPVGSERPEGGARAMRRAGLLLASCCVLFATAQGRSVLIAVSVLLVGAVVHVFGEMLQGAGQWSVSFGLAPDHAQGQYQGLFAMSVQLGTVATPALATLLLANLGWLGWLVLAGPLALAGLAAPAVSRTA